MRNLNEISKIIIEDIDLKNSTYRILNKEEINTIGDIIGKWYLLEEKLDKSQIIEVKIKLRKYGLEYDNNIKRFSFRIKNQIPETNTVDTPIDKLNLNIKSYNTLKRANINTVKDLLIILNQRVLKTPFQKVVLKDITEKLKKLGIDITEEEGQIICNYSEEIEEQLKLNKQVNSLTEEINERIERIEKKQELLKTYKEMMEEKRFLESKEQDIDNQLNEVINSVKRDGKKNGK